MRVGSHEDEWSNHVDCPTVETPSEVNVDSVLYTVVGVMEPIGLEKKHKGQEGNLNRGRVCGARA
ncbi:hypothetical protein AMATHDRAFT_55349 [Amanita thiersii Skay4041]|uniref:Uncharacterized protein n=1 Tax=Amanita thiersii Skay4041 TaxID=703135 RepID=A0A2A9NZH1_9AGAR|nr:hypothetical protein AMATHDRAFT_55349 [Amanita thiersii Skay4041]